MPNLVLNGVQYSYRDLLMIITENERLRSERDELKAENTSLKTQINKAGDDLNAYFLDAERYRWLKTFALYRNEHDASIEFYWSRRAYDLDVDAAIDAEREGG